MKDPITIYSLLSISQKQAVSTIAIRGFAIDINHIDTIHKKLEIREADLSSPELLEDGLDDEVWQLIHQRFLAA